MNEAEWVIFNGRSLVPETEWTRVRPSLNQIPLIDYAITDTQLMKESSIVKVDTTDIGASDYFLV